MTEQCLRAFDERWQSRLLSRGLKRRVVGRVIDGKLQGMSDKEAAQWAQQGCTSIELLLLSVLIQAAIKFAIWWFNNRRTQDADVPKPVPVN